MQETRTSDSFTIVEMLRRLGLTQVEFARLIDYTPEHVNCVLRGRHPGSAKFWRACARVLTTKTEVA